MKCLFVFVAIAIICTTVQGSSASYKDNVKTYIQECTTSTGVDSQLVKNSREKGDFANDEKLKQYYYCVAKKLNFVTESGDFQAENVKAVVPDNADKDKAYKIIDDCVQHKGDTKEETAFLAYKCYKEHGYTFA